MHATYRRMSITGMMLIVLMGAAAACGGLVPRGVLAQESTQEAVLQDTLTHTVRQGDTLYSISRRYDVSIEQIRRLNGLEDNAISIGQVLKLTDADPAGAAADSMRATADAEVDSTDAAIDSPDIVDAAPAEDSTGADSTTADSTAADPTAADSTAADSTSADSTAADSTAPGSIVSAGGNIGRVIVPSGTPLINIAVRFALHPDSLIALNPGLADPLVTDTGVHVPVDRLVRLVTVRRGDTLFSIGRAHDVPVSRLRDVNDLSSDNLAVGQELRIPVDRIEMDELRPAAPVHDIIPAAAYPASYSGRRLLDGRAYDRDSPSWSMFSAVSNATTVRSGLRR